MALISKHQQYNNYHQDYSTTKMTIFQNDYLRDDHPTIMSSRKRDKKFEGLQDINTETMIRSPEIYDRGQCDTRTSFISHE